MNDAGWSCGGEGWTGGVAGGRVVPGGDCLGGGGGGGVDRGSAVLWEGGVGRTFCAGFQFPGNVGDSGCGPLARTGVVGRAERAGGEGGLPD